MQWAKYLTFPTMLEEKCVRIINTAGFVKPPFCTMVRPRVSTLCSE